MWRCDSLQGAFEVQVRANGDGYFAGDGTPHAVEEVGNALLTEAQNAEPRSSGIWS
jgi:hypothetical protein